MSQGDVLECESRGRASVEGAYMSVGEVAVNRRWVVLVLLIVTAAGCRPRTTWPGVDKVVSAVDAQRARDAVAELASPTYAGRRTGTPGESFLGDRGMAIPYAGSGSVEADAVLAGFGVQMTGYDEHAGLDVAALRSTITTQ